jgi:signal peptidase II
MSSPADATSERALPPAARPPHPVRRRRSPNLLRVAAVSALVLVLDRLTKHLVVTGIAVGDVHKFLPGISLVDVRNDGVAFGFLSGGGAIVLVVTLVALGALVAYFLWRPERPLLWLPTGMLIGGAVGNLIDRLTSGSVTDFIKLPLWPAFNLADTSITLGVLALLYVLEGPRTHDPSSPAAPAR